MLLSGIMPLSVVPLSRALQHWEERAAFGFRRKQVVPSYRLHCRSPNHPGKVGAAWCAKEAAVDIQFHCDAMTYSNDDDDEFTDLTFDDIASLPSTTSKEQD